MSDSNQFKALNRVREAREALQGKALDLYDKHMKLIDMAFDTGELEVAMKHLQWLSEHMPTGEGNSMIDSSIDNVKKVEGQKGPNIQIGIALGQPRKSLPTPSVKVIDVTPENN